MPTLVPLSLSRGQRKRPSVEGSASAAGFRPWILALHLALTVFAAFLPTSSPAIESASLRLELGSHSGPIRRVSVSTDLGIVATASDDRTVRLWRLASGELVHTLRPATGAGAAGRMYGVAINPAQPIVAVAGTTSTGDSGHLIYIFDVASGRLLESFDAKAGDVKRLAWSPDGSLLLAVYAGSHGLRAFDREGREVFFDGFTGPSYGLAVGTDGTVAATSMDGWLHLYRIREGTLSKLLSAPTGEPAPVSAAFSPDSRRVVVGFHTNSVTAPRVFDAGSGAETLRLSTPSLDEGNVSTVAWSADGRLIFAGGTGSRSGRAYPVVTFDAVSGQVEAAHDLAANSITDLIPMEGSSLAYASADASWGVTANSGRLLESESRIPDLRGASNLKVDASARRVGWTTAFGKKSRFFDFATRVVTEGDDPELTPPRARRGLFTAPSNWENDTRTEVGGRAVPLSPGEVSRAFAYLGDTTHGALGTSRALYRIDGEGHVVWRVETNTEVSAVNASTDGRLLVTGMIDGTLRWWRASDGQLLLSFFAAHDGSWIMWTPNGYFDASAGADGLAGWAVRREDQPISDFFSLGRFRDKLQRGDVIDRLFSTLDVAVAVAEADRAALAAEQGSAATAQTAEITSPAPLPPSVQAVATPTAVVSPIELFPPVISPLGPTVLRTIAPAVELPFALRAQQAEAGIELEVRIDGRPAEVQDLRLPTAFDGNSQGLALVPVPDDGAVVQILARNSNGFSEPLTFTIERSTPAPAVQPSVEVKSPAAVPVPPVARPHVQPTRSGPSSPRLFILSIGVSEYQRKEYQLGLASKDARDFSTALERQAGKLYAEVSARTLTDEQAGREAIIEGLDWLARSVGPDDIGMLFLAGHGLNDPRGRYFFLPHDGNHEQLADTAVPESSIRDTLGKMRGKSLLFIDTCFAGNALGTFRSASRELARLANELASSENGVVVFASSSGRQLSEERDEWGNGAFTKSVVEGLSGKADLTRTGRITFKALDFYVSEEVRRLTSGRQTPVTISPAGVPDFTVARVI